jgi:hypothetical protein
VRNQRLIDLGAENADRRRNVREAIRTNTLGVRNQRLIDLGDEGADRRQETHTMWRSNRKAN